MGRYAQAARRGSSGFVPGSTLLPPTIAVENEGGLVLQLSWLPPNIEGPDGIAFEWSSDGIGGWSIANTGSIGDSPLEYTADVPLPATIYFRAYWTLIGDPIGGLSEVVPVSLP